MSRETDSSSSGPQGRGGAAYPSGTPPYGTDAVSAPAQPEEKKTETTLTTRIRINIPGSRPIPPVVMRTPMSDLDDAPEQAPAEAPAAPPEPRPQAAEEPKPTSDWFAPRKAPAADRAEPAPAPRDIPGVPQAYEAYDEPGADPSTGSYPLPGTGGDTGSYALPGTDRSTGAHHVPGLDPDTGSYPLPGDTGSYPLPGGTGSYPVPGVDQSTGAHHVPGLDPDTGSYPVPGTGGPAGSYPGPSLDADTGTQQIPVIDPLAPQAPGMPYFSDGPQGGPVPDRAEPPAGPTTGPVAGSTPMGAPATPPGARAKAPAPNPAQAPNPAAGYAGGAPRLSDDTAVLTPQRPAPEGGPDQGHVSGDTLTSGIPFVPDEPRPQAPAPAPAPAAPAAATPPKAAPSKKKGRSKLVLLGAGVVGLAGVAYGAGLLMNHSDVPKGTSVLGVDIGGGSRDEAVAKLDAAVGKRAAMPLQLTVGGKKEQLSPDKAGLSLDSQATVRGAAGSDYNPVSVIGSLFGGEREAEAVLPVDEEKLGVALADLAGVAGSASEGTVTFEPNKVTAVPGKSGQTLDVQKSMASVRDAFFAQVKSGKPVPVELPVATREPTVTKAELDRAMKEFAKPAMSGNIKIVAGAKSIEFGPSRSLPQILSMKAVNGRLVEVYDKKAIDRLLDGVFDGIMITKGDGKKHQVSADDVAFAMQTALKGKTRAERTVTIDLDPKG
ncbi:hypothetical protein ABT160_06585 [Streptomyces sp. NPDC001941]|uniref:hypothetical protein n=1 Tax=Streptomyces sp. NPDC001941 TaxID=3154659 RepID=UPI003327CA24